MTIKQFYPTQRPALDLNFARQKRLDPRVTFTRGSIATYVGSDGLIKTVADNEARFDHDPETGESLGLLVEESRTNYIDESNDLSQWNRQLNSPVFDANTTDTLSPDGTYNSTKITGGTSSGASRDNILAVSASTTYTASIFAKKGTTDSFRVELGSGGDRVAVNFNLSTKEFDSISAGGYFTSYSLSYVDYPNGWVRVIVSGTTDGSASGNINLALYGVTNGYIYFWGAQLEAGSFPTSYIPTSGSAVTRAADVAEITGSNFSSWYNQSAGTVFVNTKPPASQANVVVTSFTGNIDNRLEVRSTGTAISTYRNVIVSGGAVQYDTTGSSGGVGYRKIALRYGSNDAQSAAAGVLGVQDNAVTIPTVSKLFLGNDTFATTLRPNHIARLTYYPYRLPDATLQEITS